MLVFLQTPSAFKGAKPAIPGPQVGSPAMALTPLVIFDLKDKHITLSDRIILRGQARGADSVLVDNQAVDVNEGSNFRVGLVIKKGKNLIRVVAKYGPSEQKQIIRVLRLLRFPDMDAPYDGAHWAKKDIINLATVGVIEGYPDDTFGPKNNITRGEFATWVVRAMGDAVEKPTQDPFSDVPKEHWRAPYIREAALKKYMSGSPKGAFGVDDPISRADVAKVVSRARGLNYADARKVFIDVPLGSPNSADVYNAYRAGLLIGITRGRVFDPLRPMNRAEAAKLLSRFSTVAPLVSRLFDFETGYDEARLSRVNQEPTVVWAKAAPNQVQNDGQTPLTLSAKVSDKQGLSDISQVKVDIRSLGGPPDALLYDDGTHGDEVAGDGIYTLQIVVYEDAEVGAKHIRVTAMDKSGWEGGAWLDMSVVKTW